MTSKKDGRAAAFWILGTPAAIAALSLVSAPAAAMSLIVAVALVTISLVAPLKAVGIRRRKIAALSLAALAASLVFSAAAHQASLLREIEPLRASDPGAYLSALKPIDPARWAVEREALDPGGAREAVLNENQSTEGVALDPESIAVTAAEDERAAADADLARKARLAMSDGDVGAARGFVAGIADQALAAGLVAAIEAMDETEIDEAREAAQRRRMQAATEAACAAADPQDARRAVEAKVRNGLKNPRGARFSPASETSFSPASSCVYQVVGWVDATNGFNAVIRTRYVATLRFSPPSNAWYVLDAVLVE